MSRDNKNIIYTARDIEQYLAGDLSPMQMHAMEKAALDDPLLADAIEGYEGMKNKDWNEQLVALRTQVAEKDSVAKVIPLHKTKNNWWKVAAAILVLGGGAVLTFILTQNKPEVINTPQVAQTVTTVKDDSLSLVKNEPPVSVTESLTSTASSEKEAYKVPDKKTSEIKIPVKMESKSASVPSVSESKQDTRGDVASLTDDRVVPVLTPVTDNAATAYNNTKLAEETFKSKNKQVQTPNSNAGILGRQNTDGFAALKKEQPLNNFFTAQVVSPDNSPLPFTNISIKKENFGTYADIKGMVRLVSTDSLLNVEVRSVGYLPKTITLRSGQPQGKIVLQEDEEAMKENTVVINKGINNGKSRRATLVTDSAVNVEPADGWENYNTYVANNFDIPEEILNRDFHGEVELSFDVKANGTISNIRVNKSLGAEYDEAAKRLLLEGPQWKVKKGKKTSASVKVQF